MDEQSRYTAVLVTYYAGVARDLPLTSPYARALAHEPGTAWPSQAALAQAYRTDPFLCAKLCGVANSIFFNHDHRSVFTVQEALDRVGAAYARNLLREAPALPENVDEGHVGIFWAHCMCVAHSAKAIASTATAAPFSADVAYLIAMIHDIGYLLQVHYAPDMLRRVGREIEGGERGYASTVHAAHGQELARFWYLPTHAIRAIGAHHDPTHCEESPGRWLAQVIAVSEGIVAGYWDNEDQMRQGAAFLDCARELGIDRQTLEGLQGEASRVHADCMRLIDGNGGLEPQSEHSFLRVVR